MENPESFDLRCNRILKLDAKNPPHKGHLFFGYRMQFPKYQNDIYFFEIIIKNFI